MSQTAGMKPEYVLGDSGRERQRLRMQAALVEPFTEEIFRAAGIAAGMRVVDLGCGLGDVSFLAARLVGESGQVTGIDSNPAILEEARRRNRFANVEFVHADVNAVEFESSFDAVVGRYVLVYQHDPVTTLRHASRMLKAGGILAFHEADLTGEGRSFPHAPLWAKCMEWIRATFRAGSAHCDIGLRLPHLFVKAGLPCPAMRVHVMMATGSDSLVYEWAASIVRSLVPRMEKFGIATAAEVDPDSLAERLRAEASDLHGAVLSYPAMGAWARLHS